MTFSADGTAKQGCASFKKRPTSQKRAFQKVDARDLAGKWRGCCWHSDYGVLPLEPVSCTTKKALNEDLRERSRWFSVSVFALIPVESGTRTRRCRLPPDSLRATLASVARDPGCAARAICLREGRLAQTPQ